jgi:preprotein translocase subunit SecG
MKVPWKGETGLVKSTAILATVFTLSLGLCGTNYVAFTHSEPMSNQPSLLSALLLYAGFAELFAIIASLLGLIVVLLIYAGRSKRIMAKNRSYLYYDTAVLICTTCYRRIDVKIVFEDGKVFMLKRCPEHGSERVLMADDVDYYRR